jgi:hypothetical protein
MNVDDFVRQRFDPKFETTEEMSKRIGHSKYEITLWEDTDGLIWRYLPKMYPNVPFEGVTKDVELQNERGRCRLMLTKYFPFLRLIHQQRLPLDRKREIFLTYVEIKEQQMKRQNEDEESCQPLPIEFC